MRTALPLVNPLLSLALLAALTACSGDPGSPESQLRALVLRAEEAAEEKDISPILKMISDDYSDDGGNDRQTLGGIIRYQFLRHDAVHIITRISDLSFPEPGQAELRIFAAMAGEPIPSPDRIDALNADLFRFELTLLLEDSGEWRLVTARWGRARGSDFF